MVLESFLISLLANAVFEGVKSLLPDLKDKVDESRLKRTAQKLVKENLVPIFSAYGNMDDQTATTFFTTHQKTLQQQLLLCVENMESGTDYESELDKIAHTLITAGFNQHAAQIAANDLLAAFIVLIRGEFDAKAVLLNKSLQDQITSLGKYLESILSRQKAQIEQTKQGINSLMDGQQQLKDDHQAIIGMLHRIAEKDSPPSFIQLCSYCFIQAEHLKQNWQKLPLLDDNIPFPLAAKLKIWDKPLPRREGNQEDERNKPSFEKSFGLDEGVRAAVKEALSRSKVCYLFADPGAGKSTYMQWLAREYALLFSSGEVEHVPVYIDMGSMRVGSSVLEYLLTIKKLKLDDPTGKTKTIWFFDGLDVFDGKTQVTDLFEAHQNCGCEDLFVFSSRPNYGTEKRAILPAHCVYLHPLSKEQRDEFAAKHLDPVTKKKYYLFSKQGNATEKLTEIPLLFTMSLLALRDEPEFPRGAFPMKAGIFDSFVKYTVERRTESKDKKEVADKCRNINNGAPLVFYSAFMGVDGKSYVDRLPYDFLDSLFDKLGEEKRKCWEYAVEILRDAGLVQHHENEYRVLHQQFAEHFAARHVAKDLDEAWQENKESFKKEFWKYFFEEGNDAVLEQALSMMRIKSGKPEDIVKTFMDEVKPYQPYQLFAKSWGEVLTSHFTGILRQTSYSWKKRAAAAYALGEIGGERAVDALLDALKDKDEDVRGNAAKALGEIGGEKAVDGILVALKDESRYVRMGATNALGEIGGDRAVDGLLDALKDEYIFVRSGAAESLSKIGGDGAVDGLIVALKGEYEDVRWRVAFALGKLGGERAVDALLVALKDKDKAVMRHAAFALGSIGGDRAVDALLVALKDEDKDMRRNAACALGKIGDARAVDELLVALEDEDKGMRLRAADTLGEIGGDRAVYALLVALEDEDIRCRAAEALGKIGSDRAVDALLDALKDGDKDVKIHAALALGEIGDARAVDELLIVLKDDDEFWMWWRSVDALKAMSDKKGLNAVSLVRMVVFVHGTEFEAKWDFERAFSFRIPPTTDLIPGYDEFVNEHREILERYKNGEAVDILPLLRR